MDWCVSQPDADLIRPEPRGRAVFDPKHPRRFAEFVVNDSSHLKGYLELGEQKLRVEVDFEKQNAPLHPYREADVPTSLPTHRRPL